MKHLKKLLVVVAALVLAMAMTATAFAADSTTTSASAANKGEGDFSITMTGAEAGHTFKAYKIFEGSLSADGKMGNITWANNVQTETIGEGTTDIYDEIKTALDLTEKPASAAEVAEALAGLEDDAATVQAVADIFYARKGTAEPAGSTNEMTGEQYVITKLTVGYYLVSDEYTSTPDDGAATLSRNIMAVVGDVTAQVKNDKPTVEKKILNPEPVDWNSAGIGDTVAFQITGKVPNYTGYDKYFYVINDTLSDGLTFDGVQNVVVTVDGAVVAGTDYVIYTGEQASPYTFRVAFKNIKGFTIGKEIAVTYTATVNENAEIGSPGNPNETDVTYSNNPNDSSDGNPSETPLPSEDIPTGTSVKDVTVTYVAELDLTKYKDNVAEGNQLAGATFTLTGTANVVKGTGEKIFVENENGAYWALKDGTYTTTAPHGDIKDSDNNVVVASNEKYYASTEKKYSLQHVTEYTAGTEEIFMQGTSGEDGKIVFTGLGPGTYTLTEVITPAGYNTIDPIEFTVVVTVPSVITSGQEDATFSVSNVTPEGTSISMKDGDATCGVYVTDVINKSGTVLPSTGGMGTTILYIVGGIMVLLAVVFLVTKKRVANKKDDHEMI